MERLWRSFQSPVEGFQINRGCNYIVSAITVSGDLSADTVMADTSVLATVVTEVDRM